MDGDHPLQFPGAQARLFTLGATILDAQGNLYGATVQGGIVGPGCGIDGCGTIFELSLVNGVWTKTTIYEFQGGAAGAYPKAPLVFDSDGNLYGTTQVGGNKNSCGIVFEISQGVETGDHSSVPCRLARNSIGDFRRRNLVRLAV